MADEKKTEREAAAVVPVLVFGLKVEQSDGRTSDLALCRPCIKALEDSLNVVRLDVWRGPCDRCGYEAAFQ